MSCTPVYSLFISAWDAEWCWEGINRGAKHKQQMEEVSEHCYSSSQNWHTYQVVVKTIFVGLITSATIEMYSSVMHFLLKVTYFYFWVFHHIILPIGLSGLQLSCTRSLWHCLSLQMWQSLYLLLLLLKYPISSARMNKTWVLLVYSSLCGYLFIFSNVWCSLWICVPIDKLSTVSSQYLHCNRRMFGPD